MSYSEIVKKLEKIEDIDLFSEENKNKPIYVIWSGGCDSTVMLDNILWELNNRNPIGDKNHFDFDRKITTIEIEHNQLGRKNNHELIAREQYINYVEKTYKNVYLQRKQIKSDLEVVPGTGTHCCQAALWLSLVIPAITSSDAIVCFGYITGDSFFNAQVQLNWFQILESLSSLYGKKLTAFLPLAGYNKVRVISELKRRKLYNLTWYCETPLRGKPCKTCLPCKTHNNALKEIQLENRKNKKIELKYDSHPISIDTPAMPCIEKIEQKILSVKEVEDSLDFELEKDLEHDLAKSSICNP